MSSVRRVSWKLFVACTLLAGTAVANEPADELASEPVAETGTRDPAAAQQASEREELEPRVSSVDLTEGLQASRQVGADRDVIDRLDLDRTEITGNQELPKVLYIVPWQKSDPGDLMGRPVNSLLDEVLAPLDREEFIRQVDYHSDLYSVTGEKE